MASFVSTEAAWTNNKSPKMNQNQYLQYACNILHIGSVYHYKLITTDFFLPMVSAAVEGIRSLQLCINI